jgi:hypothetical protein
MLIRLYSERCCRKHFLPIPLIHYSDICLKGQNKTMRIVSQDNRPPDRALNPGSPEYETRVLFIAS